MRWDRLFAELEAQVDDDELLERDALVADLRDEEVGATAWLEHVAGTMDLDVVGAGRLHGRVELVNERLIRLSGSRHDQIIAVPAVNGVRRPAGAPTVTAPVTNTRTTPAPGAVASRLGWGPILRAVRDEAEPVRIVRRDGSVVDGLIHDVLADAVAVASGEHEQLVPFAQFAVVTLGWGA